MNCGGYHELVTVASDTVGLHELLRTRLASYKVRIT